MKLTTFATSCLSIFSIVKCQAIEPSYIEYEADLVERDLNIPSLVSDLLDGFDVADVVSNIDFDRIAGWADDLLNSGDNIDILDNILIRLRDTKLLPNTAVYIVTHNETWPYLERGLPVILSVAGNINTTSLFTALDRSGLAYSVVAGAITDRDFLPSVLEIVRKTIRAGGINLTSLLQQAGELVQRDEIYSGFEESIEPPFELIEKRDNVEDLLTTVMGSIARSGLVNDTVHTLLTNDDFQDAAVVLIQGALQNIGSVISGTDFSALQPFIQSLWNSNLLQHTIERALNDADLRRALTSDVASLLREGSIRETDIVSKEDKPIILAREAAANSTSASESDYASATGMASVTSEPSSTSSVAASATSSDSDDLASGFAASYVVMAVGILAAFF